MKEIIVMIITGVVSTAAFALLFSVNPKRLAWSCIGGLIGCIIYAFTKDISAFVSSALAAFAITVYSEIVARSVKAPVVTFLTPGIIPLVPGGALYYTISNIIFKNPEKAAEYGLVALDTCLGIAAGILVASLIVNIITIIVRKNRKKKMAQSR